MIADWQSCCANNSATNISEKQKDNIMPTTLALDIYGTLIDPLAVKTALEAHMGDEALATLMASRTKDLLRCPF